MAIGRPPMARRVNGLRIRSARNILADIRWGNDHYLDLVTGGHQGFVIMSTCPQKSRFPPAPNLLLTKTGLVRGYSFIKASIIPPEVN